MRISDWSSDVCSSELAFVNTNHGHDFGIKHQDSFVKWEGDKGAIKATLGKNINFPKGEADHFEYFLSGEPQQGWVSADIPGAWYPDAFVATMADLQCAIETLGSPHVTSVKNAYDTMRLVEAAYLSNGLGGTEIPYSHFNTRKIYSKNLVLKSLT